METKRFTEGDKSVARADLLFRRVSIQLHADIPKDDVAYFRLSELKRMDELRHGIIHGDGLQKVGLKDGVEPCSFSMKPLTPPCAPLLLHTRYRFRRTLFSRVCRAQTEKRFRGHRFLRKVYCRVTILRSFSYPASQPLNY